MPTEEGFSPVDLSGKGDEVVNLVDSSLTGQRVEWPPLLQGSAESSCTWNRGFGVGLPIPKTDRHRMAGRGRGRTPSLKGSTCRRSSLTTARRAVGGGGALCVVSRAKAERSGAGSSGSRRLNIAVAEGSGT